MLGWQRRTPHPDRVVIDGREAVVTATPSTTRRATVPAPEPTPRPAGRRRSPVIDAIVAASPATPSRCCGSLRTRRSSSAPRPTSLDDPHAIVEDEVGFVALAVDRDVLARHTEWPPPTDIGRPRPGVDRGRPGQARPGCRTGRAWVVTPAAYAAELLDRLT